MRTYVKKLWVAESARVFSDARSSLRRDSPRRTGTEAREALAQSQRLILAPVGTEDYVQNEKWINEILLKVVEFGRDSLTTEEIEEVTTLAHSCPSVNGLGVYYARFLNAYYEPLAGYDDYALCNASAKGAKGPYDFIYTFLHSTRRGIDTAIVPEIGHENQMMVYPVPASGIVNFRLQEPPRADATLRIYDVAGRLIFEQRWLSGVSHQSIPIDRIAPGLYTWSLSEPSVCLAGKFIIERK